MKQVITQYIEDNIRPYLRSHNGDLSLVDITEGVVKIKLFGACAGCPQSDLTTKDYIEEALCTTFSQVKEVVIIKEVSPELIDFAKAILRRKGC